MKNYEIFTLENDERVLVAANSYINPLSNILFISKELSEMDYKGEVIFDLLMSNGFAPNRFLKINFDDGKFLLNSREIVSDIKSEVLSELSDIYYSHPEWIEQSSLSNPHKDILKKNLKVVI